MRSGWRLLVVCVTLLTHAHADPIEDLEREYQALSVELVNELTQANPDLQRLSVIREAYHRLEAKIIQSGSQDIAAGFETFCKGILASVASK